MAHAPFPGPSQIREKKGGDHTHHKMTHVDSALIDIYDMPLIFYVSKTALFNSIVSRPLDVIGL